MWATVPGPRQNWIENTADFNRCAGMRLGSTLATSCSRNFIHLHFASCPSPFHGVWCQLWWSSFSSECDSRSRHRFVFFGDDEQGVVVGRRERIGVGGENNTDCSATSFVTFLDLGSCWDIARGGGGGVGGRRICPIKRGLNQGAEGCYCYFVLKINPKARSSSPQYCLLLAAASWQLWSPFGRWKDSFDLRTSESIMTFESNTVKTLSQTVQSFSCRYFYLSLQFCVSVSATG